MLPRGRFGDDLDEPPSEMDFELLRAADDFTEKVGPRPRTRHDYLIASKVTAHTELQRRISFWVPPSDYALIRAYAQHTGRPVTRLAADWLERWITALEAGQRPRVRRLTPCGPRTGKHLNPCFSLRTCEMLKRYAAAKHMPLTQLLRGWVETEIARLRRRHH